jgi:hypothetical protein
MRRSAYVWHASVLVESMHANLFQSSCLITSLLACHASLCTKWRARCLDWCHLGPMNALAATTMTCGECSKDRDQHAVIGEHH